ncbi:MAG: AAA family ATPase, partial [Spirochaetales bacterium]|nr:AAA family ATPase [Spirochaetales bacterium]
MFLKSVELFGFKSFADRSRIEFTDGISALLGPNGCGKSNVVDAIKWVLGEQGAKSLRADKMEDVIFNGTETRKPLNVAEVALTLANEEGRLSYDEPEVVVKRRLYRSGESEYLINNKPVLLRELREVFYDTGIGKSAYSIMEQGRIDQVLSSKPEERRLIFEEAAGITKFKIQRQEAERKLAAVEEDMRQIGVIIDEVKRSYDSLKAQSEKTLRYRELADVGRALEIDIQLLRLKDFLEAKAGKEKSLEERTKRRDAIKEEIDGINGLLQENLDVVNSMESELVEKQKKIYGIGVEKQSLENESRMLAEQLSDFEARIVADEAREKSLQEKIAGVVLEAGQRKKSLEEARAGLLEIGKNIGEFEESVRSAEGHIRENEASIRSREAEIHHLEEEDETLRGELRGLTDTIVEELDQRLKDSGYSSRERARTEAELDALIESLRIQLDGGVKLLEDALRVGGAGASGGSGGGVKALEAVLEACRELFTKIAGLGQKFGEYKRLSPSFIDEFLAPEGIITQKRGIDNRIQENLGKIRENRNTIRSLREENAALSLKIDEYRKTLEELRLGRERIKTTIAGEEENIVRLEREEEAQRRMLTETAQDIARLRERIGEAGQRQAEMKEKKRAFEEAEKLTRKELAKLEASISLRNQEQLAKEKKRQAQMEELAKTQLALDKLQIDLTEINTDIRNVYDNFRERHSRELADFENRIYEITTPVKDLRDSLMGLREELKKLGQPNWAAPEEFSEVKKRYEFQCGQLEDVKKSREDLERVAVQLRSASEEMFLSNYKKIRT